MAVYLRKQGILSKISERVCFARRRFGHYEQGVTVFHSALTQEKCNNDAASKRAFDRHQVHLELRPFQLMKSVPFVVL